MLRKALTALLFLPLAAVGIYAFSPQHPENPHVGYHKQYPAAAAYSHGEDSPEWKQFIEDRRNGLR